MAKEVIIYSTQSCPYCRMAKDFFTRKGIAFKEVDLTTDDAKRDFALNEWGLLPGRVGVSLELRTVRTRTHKLTIDLISGAGELYDLTADSKEENNLFDTPDSGDVQEKLLAMIHSRPVDIGDHRVPVGTA